VISGLWARDKDMIVMYHRFGQLDGVKKQIDGFVGDDQTYTAMAKTVSLPVVITVLNIKRKITTPGVL
jgi:hypothetical protein